MNILCLGDSIMQYNDWTSYPQTGWIQCLDRFFTQNVKILNFARNGRSTKSFIDEGRFKTVLDNARPGDYALIQFAHNDEKQADPSRWTSPEIGGEFRSNLEYFVTELAQKGVKSVLLTPVTRRTFNESQKIKDSHGLYSQAVKDTAEKLNVPCIDMNSLTKEYFEKKSEKESRSYFMNFGPGLYENFPEGKADDSHLRPDGAYAVCRHFISALIKTKGQNAGYDSLYEEVCTKGIYEDKEIDDEKLMW